MFSNFLEDTLLIITYQLHIQGTYLLTDPKPYNPEDFDGLPEIVAMIYFDEENPPVDTPEDCSEADPYVNIVYDLEAQVYGCEGTIIDSKALENIAEPTLQKAIEKAIAILDNLSAIAPKQH